MLLLTSNEQTKGLYSNSSSYPSHLGVRYFMPTALVYSKRPTEEMGHILGTAAPAVIISQVVSQNSQHYVIPVAPFTVEGYDPIQGYQHADIKQISLSPPQAKAFRELANAIPFSVYDVDLDNLLGLEEYKQFPRVKIPFKDIPYKA